jgi:pyruvate dehydrogenase E2 component (dihydrolipoamide acetyltransferase)
MIEFKLPSLGAEMDEGTLVEWKVKPGDVVHKGDVVAVVDTSKSAIDVEIWQDGTVLELLLDRHDTAPVGTVIARLLEPGETREHAEAEKRRLAEAAPAKAPAAPAPSTPPPAKAAPVTGAEERRRVSPAARVHAQNLGIDLARVTGTGPQGAVTLEDVERAAARKPSPEDRALAMRTAIGAAMARSKREIPHYYLGTRIDLSRALAWLAAENARRPVGDRLLPAVLLLRAVALAAREVPETNGHFVEGAFRPASAVHLGVGISLRQGGLVAPALHDADRKGVDDLMRELADLVRRTRAGVLRSSEIAEATLTVTNLGDQGVESVYGVIQPPQVALVGFGRIAEQPWAQDGLLGVRPVVVATLAADHRVSDGHGGGRFLSAVDRLLQEPEKL